MTELEKAVAWLEHWKMVKECDARNYPHRTEHAEIAANCRVLLDALRWVPVSERLPTEDDADDYGKVLCLWVDDDMEAFSAKRIEEWNRIESIKITHWRALPAPPEQEG